MFPRIFLVLSLPTESPLPATNLAGSPRRNHRSSHVAQQAFDEASRCFRSWNRHICGLLSPATAQHRYPSKSGAACRGCDLWENGAQTVFGKGPSKALVMFVGEQPGDQETGRVTRSLAGREGCSIKFRWESIALKFMLQTRSSISNEWRHSVVTGVSITSLDIPVLRHAPMARRRA